MSSTGASVCSDEIVSSTAPCPWPRWAGRTQLAAPASCPLPPCAAPVRSWCLLHGVATLHQGTEKGAGAGLSYKAPQGALCWDVGDHYGNEKVMLDWEGYKTRVCVCVRACGGVCVYERKWRIKMGTETPRGKLPFGWLALDNSFLEEVGRRGRNTKENDEPSSRILN